MSDQKQKKLPRVAGSSFKSDRMGVDILDQVDEFDDDEISAFQTMVPVVCLFDGAAVRFNISGRKYVMRHGDIQPIEAGYACIRQLQENGDPIPSAIELLTNRKVLPVSDARVIKDQDGTPQVTVQARAKVAEAKAAARTQRQAAT